MENNEKKPGPAKGTKYKMVPKYKKEKYVNECVRLISKSFYSPGSLYDHFSKYGLTVNNIETIIRDAEEIITSRLTRRSDNALEKAENRLLELIQECKESGSKKIMIEAIKELHKIQGLHSQNITINGSLEIPTTIKLVEMVKTTPPPQDLLPPEDIKKLD